MENRSWEKKKKGKMADSIHPIRCDRGLSSQGPPLGAPAARSGDLRGDSGDPLAAKVHTIPEREVSGQSHRSLLFPSAGIKDRYDRQVTFAPSSCHLIFEVTKSTSSPVSTSVANSTWPFTASPSTQNRRESRASTNAPVGASAARRPSGVK